MTTTPHRLFFALWPDDNVRQMLKQRIQKQLTKHPAKKVPVHNWHMTLAFLGNVSAEAKLCAQKQANLLHGPHFTLQLDHFGYFKRARVAWLGCKDVPPEMVALFEQLNALLAPCGYASEHQTLIPHMTLLRKANKGLDALNLEPIEWRINDFVLVESQITDRGSVYKVINRWSLV